MNLYDILACPTCKVKVIRKEQTLICSQCQREYPIINNVPVLFPDGSIPDIQHESDLLVRSGYNPWIERLVMQSLPASSIVLDLGAGNMAFNLPHVIRMDVTLTPFVDVVGDAHALPFLPGTFDFIFSLAVIEHLRQPFVAAQEMYNALRNGGYIYGECNFVFPYHGYPHHYFNMTQQGIEQVFSQFRLLRSGVAPYHMPSFGIRPIISTYKHYLGNDDDPEISAFQMLLEDVLNQPLGKFDGRFSEEAALRIAAGVFYFGIKSPSGTSDVIPAIVQTCWQQSPELQQRFPDMFHLGTVNNIMLWAKTEGCQQEEKIAEYFKKLIPFHKSEEINAADLKTFSELPVVEPAFGNIVDTKRGPTLSEKVQRLEQLLAEKNQHILYLEGLIKRLESGRVMRLLRTLKL